MWTSLFTKDHKWDLRMLKCWSLLWVLNSSFLLHHQKLPTCLDVGHDQVQVQEGVGGGAAAQRAEAEQTTARGQGATTGRPDVHHHQPPPHADGAVHRPWPHPCPWRRQDLQQINSVPTFLFNFVISELFCCRPDLRDNIERCANIEILEDEQDEDKMYLNTTLDCLWFTRSNKADI